VLPTRLVAVHETSTGLSARLCNTQSLPASTRYLTLSHCWGNAKVIASIGLHGIVYMANGNAKLLTLRESNKDLFETLLPVQKLSITFKDALYATVKLGFNYIWIDSLYIIQDSKDNADWKVEAAKMCAVYKHTACNLAACAAPKPKVGLSTGRGRYDCIPVRTRVNWLNNLSNQYAYIQEDNYWKRIEATRLFERAWVFQEQLLVRDANNSLLFA
jgi:hypothetical protein